MTSSNVPAVNTSRKSLYSSQVVTKSHTRTSQVTRNHQETLNGSDLRSTTIFPSTLALSTETDPQFGASQNNTQLLVTYILIISTFTIIFALSLIYIFSNKMKLNYITSTRSSPSFSNYKLPEKKLERGKKGKYIIVNNIW